MRNDYNTIAPWYDRLSRLVFGRAQVAAQTVLLPYIEAGSRILIVGGGSGWILEELSKIHSSGLKIVYVEISKEMIHLSRKRRAGQHEIVFVERAVENYEPDGMFDVVFTAFLFDNFKEEKAHSVFSLLHNCLKPTGKWLFVDFQYTVGKHGWWQWLFLKIMLCFFKVVSKIEATTLVDMQPSFREAHYKELFKLISYRTFIRSVVYQK
jgi:ubiquinone/menaquinone biosynthesis C-methylase UbiE